MPNVCLAVGMRLTVAISFFWTWSTPAWCQDLWPDPYYPSFPGMNGVYAFSPRVSLHPGDAMEPFTVSTDVLRRPLSLKTRRLIEKAMQRAELGDHASAIDSLRLALGKHPLDAAYIHNVLGMEYLRTNRFTEANVSFEEAVRLMPRESANHSNLGLSLALIGQPDSAEAQERKALQLNHTNSKAKIILEALLLHKRTHSPGPQAAKKGSSPD